MLEDGTDLGRHAALRHGGAGVRHPQAHDHLTIDVRARVVTSPRPAPPEGDWEALTAPAHAEAAGEHLLATGPEPPDHLLDDLPVTVRARAPPATLRLLCELLPDRFAYRTGVTYVGSTVGNVLAAGAGVCQDLVHLGLVLLRRQGIAARYVSGHLWAAPEADRAPQAGGRSGTDSVEVQTHAWIEALLPGDDGRGEPVWVGADPTNRRLAGETHVTIGHGRMSADVPPIKGVVRGPASAELDASVEMTRLDASASARA